MDEEMVAFDKNEDCDLVELLTRRNLISSKWVFKNKLNAEGKVEKYKARLVGYSQVEGIDFGEIFSPVAKLTSIRLLLSEIYVVSHIEFSWSSLSVDVTFLSVLSNL